MQIVPIFMKFYLIIDIQKSKMITTRSEKICSGIISKYYSILFQIEW